MAGKPKISKNLLATVGSYSAIEVTKFWMVNNNSSNPKTGTSQS
jgi:hypothetical protein